MQVFSHGAARIKASLVWDEEDDGWRDADWGLGC